MSGGWPGCRWRSAPGESTSGGCACSAAGSQTASTPGRWARNPLVDRRARDYAARDFKRFLKRERRLGPASVNLALAAVDHFYRHLGLERANVRREELPRVAPRALDRDEQRQLMRAVERAEVRDRALVVLLLFAALRISEAVALDLEDVRISSRKGTVVVQ
jgi:site-specific recombinase XerC